MARPKQGWRLRKHWNRYFVRFTHDGQRIELPTGSGDPEEAAERAAKLYAEYHTGKPPVRVKAADPQSPVADVAALWLADVERELDEGTVATLMVYVRHFEAFFGTFGQITDASCARYARERLGSVKRPTVQKELSALRRFVGWSKSRACSPARLASRRRRSGQPEHRSSCRAARSPLPFPPKKR